MADTTKSLTEVFKSLIRPGGEPIMGNALVKTEEIKDIDEEVLAKIIRDELGFTRESKLIKKKIEAAKNPEQYFKKRTERLEELSETIADFVKDYAGSLRKAGYTAEETGIISRYVAKQLGDMMKVPIDLEYPTEFARKGIEDLLERKYR